MNDQKAYNLKTYKEYIEELKKKWIGQKVQYKGGIYNVIDVDMNGAIHIDKPKKYCESHTNETTAIEAWKIKDGVYTEPHYELSTPNGDIWKFDTLEEARKNKYIFGGEITCKL